MARPVVVDTNILFSALLRGQSRFAELLLTFDRAFYVNELVFVELFKHKDRIVRFSELSEEQVIQLLYKLAQAVDIYKEDLVTPANRRRAYALCRDIDKMDAPHLAITLELKGLLWTGDAKLKSGLRAKGFNDFFEPPPPS